jgi:hypothetical protein
MCLSGRSVLVILATKTLKGCIIKLGFSVKLTPGRNVFLLNYPGHYPEYYSKMVSTKSKARRL